MNPAASSGPSAIQPQKFSTTRWSVVLHAGRNDTPNARAALEQLCRTYWYPLYSHVRRHGHAAHQAEDLTQEFFARLLEKQTLGLADPERGRFRSFILTALDHFLADERDKARALKRGGGAELLSLDLAAAERRYDLEPTDGSAPDRAFDRQWAMTLLETVLHRLEQEYRHAGKAAVFASLKETLTGTRESQPYGELAAQLGMNEGAVKVTVHRLRQRYRVYLREEIAHTVSSPEEAGEEMRHLFRTLTGD